MPLKLNTVQFSQIARHENSKKPHLSWPRTCNRGPVHKSRTHAPRRTAFHCARAHGEKRSERMRDGRIDRMRPSRNTASQRSQTCTQCKCAGLHISTSKYVILTHDTYIYAYLYIYIQIYIIYIQCVFIYTRIF